MKQPNNFLEPSAVNATGSAARSTPKVGVATSRALSLMPYGNSKVAEDHWEEARRLLESIEFTNKDDMIVTRINSP
jgi:predicted lipoprotein